MPIWGDESGLLNWLRQRRNPIAVKIEISNFKRKRSTDKSECASFIQDVEILYRKGA